jgi:hypothetical protein
MIRPGLLAVLAVVLAPLPSPAQMGGMMGGMGGRGGGMMGGMGGMMGGQSFGQERAVKIEMTGGQSVAGKLYLGTVFIDTDVGEYAIDAEKVKSLRLSKPVDELNRQGSDGTSYNLIQGIVVTTSNKEIRGAVHVPEWRLRIDDGTLKLIPQKLKTVAIAAEPEKQPTEKTSAKGQGTSYSRLNDTIFMNSAGGDRVTFVDIGTKKSTSVRLSESKASGLKAVPIWGSNVVALMISGPKVTRISAANSLTGVWHTQELREPVKGTASPLVAPGVVAYGLGRYVYAYSAATQRWGVVELPHGMQAVPIVSPDSVRVETPGHIYTFDSQTARWNHVDIGELLETARAEDQSRN